jgi:hypothetical protein
MLSTVKPKMRQQTMVYMEMPNQLMENLLTVYMAELQAQAPTMRDIF